MRDNKKMLIAMCVALVMCVCLLSAILLLGGDEREPDHGQTELTVIRSISQSDITAFTLMGVEDTRTFEYTDSGWVYKGLSDFPLNVDFMHHALEALSVVEAVEVVAEGVDDLSPYGLDEPQMRVSVTAETEYGYYIGDYNSHNGWYYLCEEGGDTVFLVDADLPMLCAAEESEVITLGTLPDNFADGDIKRVNVNGTDYTGEHESFTALAGELHSIELTDFEKYKVGEDDLADAVKVSVYYSAATEDEYGTVSYSLELMMSADDEHLLFTVDDDPILYRLRKSAYPELTKIIE